MKKIALIIGLIGYCLNGIFSDNKYSYNFFISNEKIQEYGVLWDEILISVKHFSLGTCKEPAFIRSSIVYVKNMQPIYFREVASLKINHFNEKKISIIRKTIFNYNALVEYNQQEKDKRQKINNNEIMLDGCGLGLGKLEKITVFLVSGEVP